MRTHTEEIVIPYSIEQLYKLVADVESYPQFIPWCVAARTYDLQPTNFKADVVVGFKGITEKYTSRVHLLDNEIDVEYISGPFSCLENNWKFTPEANGTKITFFIKFQFKSKLLQALIGGLFEKAVHKMVEAFNERAKKLYG
jgi:coenzyme Q-binding protein COQ10